MVIVERYSDGGSHRDALGHDLGLPLSGELLDRISRALGAERMRETVRSRQELRRGRVAPS